MNLEDFVFLVTGLTFQVSVTPRGLELRVKLLFGRVMGRAETTAFRDLGEGLRSKLLFAFLSFQPQNPRYFT